MRSFRSLILCLAVLAEPRLARAAGSFLTDIGAVAQGQAGAYVAAPQTLNAFWYNPAALAGKRGLRFELQAGFSHTPVSFQRATSATGKTYAAVANDRPLKPGLFAAVAYDFGVRDLAVGIAAYSPVSASVFMNPRGPQRYDFVSGDNFLLHLHLGVAYRIGRFSLGATVGNTIFSTKQESSLSASLTQSPEDVEADSYLVQVKAAVSDPFTITSNFGVSVEPLEGLDLGVSLTPPYDLGATGTAEFALPNAISSLGVEVQGNRTRLNVPMPLILRAGIRYRPISLLALELAFILEGWSRHKQVEFIPEITVSAPALGLSLPLPVITKVKNRKDSYSGRLGVEVKPISLLTVRAGGAFESSGVRQAYFDLGNPDANKVNLSVGLSLNVWKLAIDLAYTRVIAFGFDTAASRLAVSPMLPPNQPAIVTGNGRYDYSSNVLYLGLRASFFDAPPPAAPEAGNAPTVGEAPATIPAP